MFTKVVALSSIAAFTGQALAFNSHRHHHHQLDKRVVFTDWVTVWETVYVTDGQEVAKAAPTTYGTPSNALSVTPTITSTSTVVIQSTSSKASSHKPHHAKPTSQATTLTMAIKPSPAHHSSQKGAAPASSSPAQQPSNSKQAPTPAPQPSSLKAPAPQPSTYQAPPSQTAKQISAPQHTKAFPAPPSPSKPATSNPSSGGSGLASKKGMAYNDPKLANIFGDSCATCHWGYNWGSSSGGFDSKFSYVPMLWGPAPDHSNNWDSMAQKALAGGSKAMFSFNEADNAGQSNLGPQAAASAHAQFMNKYAGKALIGAPSITNSGSPGEGVEWLKNFMSACDSQQGGCQVDFCNVHWYSPASAADSLFDHIEKAHEACRGKPIWLTEFAPSGSIEEINNFLKAVIPKLEALEYLHAYSYFMVSTDSLMSSSSSMSSFGSLYASL